jgi:hypothetical protein
MPTPMVGVTIDADRVSAEFKEARRDINRRTKDGLTRAGERVALPAARRNAGGLRVAGRSVAASLTVRSTSRTAYLSSSMRGKLNRAVGLLEHGGTVRTPLLPRTAKAILTPWGPRAAVRGPRTYSGKHFMSDAVSRNHPQIEDAIWDELRKAFDGLDVSR